MNDRRTAARVLAAVADVADRVGLGTVRPHLLATGSHPVVVLEPYALVAQICTDGEDGWHRASHAVQVALARHALRSAGPVNGPAARPDAGPHYAGGLLVTLWVQVIEPKPVPPAAVGRSLDALHKSLAGYAGQLDEADPRPYVRRVADLPAVAAPLAAQLRAACDTYFPPHLPTQAVHGDAHLDNAIGGPAGPVWLDLEDACRGPIEWDLAALAHRATVFGTKVAETGEALAAYGPDAADRAELMATGYGLYAAGRTVRAQVTRPELGPVAERRVQWVLGRLSG